MGRSSPWMTLVVSTILVLGAVTGATAQRDPGLSPPEACPDDDLVTSVTTDDVQGTTFVGTYLGESTSGRDMTVFWQVEEIYAGGPLSRALFWRTPSCEWANLTPGERYLFSTSATDLDSFEGSAAMAGVTDSLAWEVLDGGALRLAPFDTYAADDYAAEGPRAITTLEDALAAVASDAGAPQTPNDRDIDFGCAEGPARARLDDARGSTFVGTYVGDVLLPSYGLANHRVIWSVERVYAGGPLPEILTSRADDCQPATLQPGRRYLFSTSDIVAPGAANSLAWRIRRDGSIRPVPFGDERPGTYRARADVRAIETLDEAIEALSPGAGTGEPPERAADRTPG